MTHLIAPGAGFSPDLDAWVPACGGTETPFKSRSGITLLYCWNPKSGRHAYLDVDADCILSDAEAQAALGLFN